MDKVLLPALLLAPTGKAVGEEVMKRNKGRKEGEGGESEWEKRRMR